MLNRIYIVVGILAILALAGAFIAPRFIQWGNYRDRMEAMASEALGTKVAILGDIHFNLLPAPQLEFADVAVGPADAPVLKVSHVKAEFSLLDFLRDQYAVTRLVLDEPALNVKIDESGFFQIGLTLPQQVSTTNVSIGNATITNGTLSVADMRAGDAVTIDGLNGDIKLQALRGPFAFQGSGSVGDQRYALRVSTSAMDAQGATRLSAFAQPDNKAYSINAEGILATGYAPRFDGDLTYRQAPPPAENAEGVQGDLVLTSKVQASADQIVLPSYTLQPDENRSGIRLTGSAVVHLNEKRDFDAVVSGGAVALPPRDATKEEGPQPYELVRLLGELPMPQVPPIAGTVTVDLAELDLRGVSLRDVRIDASTDTQSWAIKTAEAHLPGNTVLRASGKLAGVEGRPSFSGDFSMATARLDGLAPLWRKPGDSNPLFNLPASLRGKLMLDGDDLRLADGSLALDGNESAVTVDVGFGPERRLDFSGKFDTLSAADTEALAALLPTTGPDDSFGVTFPQGHLTLGAQSASLFGLDGTGMVAEGSWDNGTVQVTQLTAADYGGVKFDLSGHLSGSLAEPVLAAGGSVSVTTAGAPALVRLYDLAGTPQAMRDYIGKSLPSNLKVTLEDPDKSGAQVLTATGRMGVADLGLSVQLTGGVAKALSSPLSITAELAASDGTGLTQQLGLGDISLFPEDAAVRVKAVVDGTVSDGFETDIVASGGTSDNLEFKGKVIASDLASPAGKGTVVAQLSDATALAGFFGAAGIYVPPIDATADVDFTGDRSLVVDKIVGKSNGQDFSGALQLTRQGTVGNVDGTLMLADVDVAGLTSVLGGPAALLPGASGPWPDGPLSVGDVPRSTRGAIAVTTPMLTVGGRVVTDAHFELGWDENAIRMRGLQGKFGDGTIGVELAVCCSGTIAQKQVTGRLTLDKVTLSALLPEAPAEAISGTISGSAQFNGTGASIAEVMASMVGQGNYALNGLSIAKFDPGVFKAVAGLNNILDLEPDALSSIVAMGLDQGAFAVPDLSGAITIAGGKVQTQNLTAESGGARLFGGAGLRLSDLGLDGSFALTPTGQVDDKGLITPTTSQVTAVLSGTLSAPERQLDLGSMVDAIKVRAYEVEVDRLEQLQAEDLARQKEAADERAKLMAEQKRIADEAAAKKAADEAAAKKAADDAAAAKAAQEQQTTPSPAGADPVGQPLSLPPPVFNSPSFTTLQ
ncbi:MAG TPA: AsmA family protein [Devosiaceae bacterium]